MQHIRLRRAVRGFLQTAFGTLAAGMTAAACGVPAASESWKTALFVLTASAFSAAAAALICPQSSS
ncbi:MAG: hypothetical protein II723_04295 [Oscillospiraceae bacterium]|nr:hypothetical protein [Oscillospiraceae bacterium]